MNTNSREAVISGHPAGLHLKKGKLDLVILKLMARRLYLTLHQLDQAIGDSQPLLYALEERHKRTHRIAIYRPEKLWTQQQLSFVGFVSGKRHALSQSLLAEIHSVDQKMIIELMDIAGILSYSSLELRTGRWYNLVVFVNDATKVDLKNNHTHAYAAYQLAPQYYEWIRLHNGIMPGGLAQQELILKSTKYYVFPDTQQRPKIQELKY